MTFFKSPFLLVSIGVALCAARPALGADEPPSPPTVAPTASSDRLTLESAIAEAVAQSPALRVIEADIDSARGETLTAQTKPNPELFFAPGLKHVREGDSSHNEFKGTLGLTQQFVFAGKRELLVSIAERNVELRKLGIEGLRFQLAAAVRKAFYELLAAQGIVEIRQQQLESAQTFQQAATKRAASGYASDFEAVKSQGDVITAKKLLGAAEGEIAAARVELNSLLGRDPSAPLEITGVLAGAAPERTLPDLLAAALADNPSLRVQAMQAEIAGLSVRKARLARKPEVSVGPSLEYSKSEQVLSIGATVSLPNKNYGRGELQTATAEQRKVLAETEQLRREITGAVTKAATQLATARRQLALYAPAYLEQLKAVVEQAEKSYAQNATSLLIYLDAKRTYFDTLADYYEAVASVATHRAELESAVGVPLEFQISKTNP
ncbi:MAG TPA: TolC family protein [Opitutaceae bacterium]|nr:TolC family protein [Lacunisphaera sp.]HWA09154.1 TolC family protein [Opitutaceae bacterium]